MCASTQTTNLSNFKGTSTVDPEEIDKFNSVIGNWWKKDAPVLHRLNFLRVPFITNGLIKTNKIKQELTDASKILEDMLILDAGCGGGICAEAIARLGGEVHGVDAAPESIKEAKRHAALDPSLSNLKYFTASIEDYARENFQKYDAVIASEVLEHITEKDLFLKACVHCLKPGGSIFITTFSKTWTAWIINIIITQEVLNVIPRGTHAWEKFITPEDTSKILEKYNCKTVENRGMFLNFLFQTWSWTSSTSINYALHAVKDK